MKKSAFLIGPFIGEIEWEFFRFAPYIIHLKKKHPNDVFIVYTRPSRFDLYGQYADIFIPLYLKGDDKLKAYKFTIKYFNVKKYDILTSYYYDKYKSRYKIKKHIAPNINFLPSQVKWQFPRDEMDYDFRPRRSNYKVIDGIFDSTNHSLVCDVKNFSEYKHEIFDYGYEPISLNWVRDIVVNNSENLKISILGVVMAVLSRCRFVVGNLSSPVCKLALLFKIPVISINEKITYDNLRLINPFETPVINCRNIKEGIQIYEDNI